MSTIGLSLAYGQVLFCFPCHMCMCWCSVCELQPYPSGKKYFCVVEHKDSTAANQLAARIPERSDHLLGCNSLYKLLLWPSFIPAPPPLLFLSKCLVLPDRELCEQCIALASSTLSSLSTEAGFLFTLLLKMPSLKFLYCTKLGDAFSAKVNCCDSPLKLRINVLYW